MTSVGYWRAPRYLARRLAAGTLTVTEYALLNYLAQAGADRPDGLTGQTLAALAAVFRMSEKTVSRALAELNKQGLLDYELKQGQRRPFVIRLRTQLRNLEPEVVSEVTSDTPSPPGGGKPASQAGNTSDTTSTPTGGPRPPTETRDQNHHVLDVLTAYTSTGGSLDKDDFREALERNTRSLLAKRKPVGLVVAAARQLGRERAFPGYLAQRVARLERQGGPCRWQGFNRTGLTADQLAERECDACTGWLAHRQSPDLAGEATVNELEAWTAMLGDDAWAQNTANETA